MQYVLMIMINFCLLAKSFPISERLNEWNCQSVRYDRILPFFEYTNIWIPNQSKTVQLIYCRKLNQDRWNLILKARWKMELPSFRFFSISFLASFLENGGEGRGEEVGKGRNREIIWPWNWENSQLHSYNLHEITAYVNCKGKQQN